MSVPSLFSVLRIRGGISDVEFKALMSLLSVKEHEVRNMGWLPEEMTMLLRSLSVGKPL